MPFANKKTAVSELISSNTAVLNYASMSYYAVVALYRRAGLLTGTAVSASVVAAVTTAKTAAVARSTAAFFT